MEKLVNLLNEFNGKESYRVDEDSISGEKYINRGSGDQCFIDEHIISIKYGFIKWLLGEQKIDIDKLEEELNSYPNINNEIPGTHTKTIMLLSIQSKPIDFLISLLK